MSDATFTLCDYSSDFVSRDIGKLLRARLLEFDATIPPDQQITIDASGVSIMTPSFVDEFFGRTAAAVGLEEFRRRFKLFGVADFARPLINNVVRNRLILERQEHHAT